MNEAEYAELGVMRPVRSGEGIACVPFAFMIYRRNGRKVAVPSLPKTPVKGMTASGWLVFSDGKELEACLKALETSFVRNGISNFDEIGKAVELSRSTVSQARAVKKLRGRFHVRGVVRTGAGLANVDCRTVDDVMGLDWYKTLSLRNGSRTKSEGILSAGREGEVLGDNLVRFTPPGTRFEIRGTMGLLRDYEDEYGSRIEARINTRQTIGHVKPSVHEKRTEK